MGYKLKKNNAGLSVLNLNSKNVFLEILPEKGCRISRYRLKARKNYFELLYPVNHLELIKKDSLQKASFPLIPFSNRINRGEFSFQGKQIQLPLNFYPEPHSIHGHGWQKEWAISEVKENFAVLEYEHLPNEWPFKYLARQVIELDNSDLILTIQIKNTGRCPMPAGIGFHPYFFRTPNVIVTASTKKMWINDKEKIPIFHKYVPEVKLLSQGINVEKNELDNIFTGWNHKANIFWPEWKTKLFIKAKPPINFLVIFSPFGENYFCIEPVSNVTNAFNMIEENNEEHGVRIINPGESIEGVISFSPQIN